ncbi:unnamed protein product [Adineta ricciae]|uniref:ATP-grasp domain-containing protein n=1 Tax=Adineta ricciae TaxID=249248 RepID=A0A814Z8T4_ADIRI|nr:unnamed protein product [Adineta ricciae]
MNANPTKVDEDFDQRISIDSRIFFAGTDKARVISEILEKRGWSRTKDRNVTNFTIKWCLANQVDWTKFQEGKQLINNIPGQLAFSDKINLWYTVRDYLQKRYTQNGKHMQTFLAMTFVLDDENEVAEFLRVYKKQNRTWIYKPRYNYAGRGITVLPVHSDLSTIFKLKTTWVSNATVIYISRPLLIKGRKFDIRVHWLVAWTKPLLVFYNHNASVVRLSLNLYREFDCDRTTHLTNLSVQESHSRYAFLQESTGMTINQLNQYFNQCFRPFHPKLCQDWVMTVMQERMQTIIRHVIRASKDQLAREAGQFGFFGCDFLLDENFRIWLLEINDNPGVGWGNSLVNTTTKPLIEETLNIVCECLEKHKNKQALLPINCLKNYELIYNEHDDVTRLLMDDNQIFTDQYSIRYAIKETTPRKTPRRAVPHIHTSRTSIYRNDSTHNSMNDLILPSVNMENRSPSILALNHHASSVINILSVTNESLGHGDTPDNGSSKKSKKALKAFQTKSPLLLTPPNGSTIRANKTSIKQTLSKANTSDTERKKHSESLPTIVDKKQSMYRSETFVDASSTSRNEKKLSKHKTMIKDEQENPLANVNPGKLCTLN